MKTVVVPQIPIFITARGNNTEAIKRNKEALKYNYVLINEMNIFKQTYIISDNHEMLEYAKKLGFLNLIYQECKTEYDITYLDYIGIYNFYKKTGYKPDWFILMAIGQLFKDKTLLYNCIRNIDNKYDVVASYTEISDRSSFFIENDSIISTGHMVTHERSRKKMIDAAIYAIKSDFAIHCMENEINDPSIVFWRGKIKYFENSTVYTDVLTYNDIKKYEHTGYIINEVMHMNRDKK